MTTQAPPLWYITSITQTLTPTGFIIVITTDRAVHLWLRWTFATPQKHMRTRIVRGLPVLGVPYYCFVSYHDNEQEEYGDTITHTFWKPGWEDCRVRHFYFHGEIDWEPSKSTTPIYTKTCPGPSWLLLITEIWYAHDLPPDFVLLLRERWSELHEPPTWQDPFYEPWTS